MSIETDYVRRVERAMTAFELDRTVERYLDAVGRPELRGLAYEEAAHEFDTHVDPVMLCAAERYEQVREV